MCCRGSLLIQGRPWWFLSSHSDWERCLSSGAKQMTLLSPGGEEWRCRELPARQLHLYFSIMLGQLLVLETISRHVKDKKMIRTHGHELTQGEVIFYQPDDFLQLSDCLGRGEQWVSLKYPQRNQKSWARWSGREKDGKLSECWPRACLSVTWALGERQLL